MRRRDYLAGVGTSLGALTVTGTASAVAGLSHLTSVSEGVDPSEPGSVRVDVIGTADTLDSEIEECVDALYTLFWHPYLCEYNDDVDPEIGIRGYEVHGWASDETFPHSEGCNDDPDKKSAMELSAEKLESTALDSTSTVVNWLWDHDASWSAGRGMGEPWGHDPDHQHPTFTDNKNNPSTEKLAYSCAHEVGHALLYTGSGRAYCDPESFDTQSYEGCTHARKLTAPWFTGHPDHTLGGILDNGSTLRRTPMGHQGQGYKVGACRYDGDVDYNWTYVPSDCTIEAMGHSWRHLENWDGGHGDEDEDGPDPIDEDTFETYDFDPDFYVGWDAVTDDGSAGLDYYGVEVRWYDPNDASGGALVDHATQTVPGDQDYAVLEDMPQDSKFTVTVTPVDNAGNIPEYGANARVDIET